ncbi:MAG TPA: alpha/beta hydrolase [Rhodobacteraceae bacterium]|nr:alpha/beta hydrolase [Paracoccaceae bacterium]
MEAAPLFNDIADGPEGGRAFWERTVDNVRIRLGHWPGEGTRGTVFLFPGRTEYIEKYGRAASDLARSGYGTFSIDWRGQGLADRLSDDPMLGHVDDFSEYQRDVDAMIAAARELGLPKPWYLIAHSMGGCIGLRALHRDMPVQAVMFSGPMWGIAMSALMRPVATLMASTMHKLGKGARYAPTTDGETYVLSAPFEDNQLTTDPEMWDYMVRHARAHPELTLAGPSLSWFNAALKECDALVEMAPPTCPAHTFLGANERIVDPRPVHDLMNRWENGRLEVVPSAEHEILMEKPEIRSRFFAAADELFSARVQDASSAERTG